MVYYRHRVPHSTTRENDLSGSFLISRRGGFELEKKKITVKVTSQTLFNLYKLSEMSGGKSLGWVVDKLVRDKMLEMRGVLRANDPLR